LPAENNADIVTYQLYSSDMPGIIPGPGTLLTTTENLDWLDTTTGGLTRYYVVTAVDDVGHEGNPSNEVVVGGISGVEDVPGLVTELTLHRNVPNPFNPSTKIRFSLPTEGRVILDIHGIDGRRVRRLLDTDLPEGLHTLTWQGRDDEGKRLPSGVYFAMLRSASETRIKKMVMVQ